jgi:hypothetical protein
MTNPMSVVLKEDHILIDNDLRISFHRTLRVPDMGKFTMAPPDLQKYPLKPVSQYASKFPTEVAAKGGSFFAMYREFVLCGFSKIL